MGTNKMGVNQEESNEREWGRYSKDKKVATHFAVQRKLKTEMNSKDLLISLETQSSSKLKNLGIEGHQGGSDG